MVPNLKYTVVFWALTSISGAPWRYVCLAVAFIWAAVLVVRHHSQVKHARKRDQDHRGNIGMCKGPAEQHKAPDGVERCRVPLAPSQTLEIHTSTWKKYLQTISTIFLAIDQCASEVKGIQTAMLVRIFALNIASWKTKQSQLIIEEERQRKLTEGIKNSQNALNAVVHSPTRSMSLELLYAYMTERNFKSVHTLRLVSPGPPDEIQVSINPPGTALLGCNACQPKPHHCSLVKPTAEPIGMAGSCPPEQGLSKECVADQHEDRELEY
ncbi:hypothetical protein B0H19DRAFT_1055748 [Mycena capillaripes]|nr:hypothetical protein B0H19DRAFT_1055748 [Mycena capillaripes]